MCFILYTVWVLENKENYVFISRKAECFVNCDSREADYLRECYDASFC